MESVREVGDAGVLGLWRTHRLVAGGLASVQRSCLNRHARRLLGGGGVFDGLTSHLLVAAVDNEGLVGGLTLGDPLLLADRRLVGEAVLFRRYGVGGVLVLLFFLLFFLLLAVLLVASFFFVHLVRTDVLLCTALRLGVLGLSLSAVVPLLVVVAGVVGRFSEALFDCIGFATSGELLLRRRQVQLGLVLVIAQQLDHLEHLVSVAVTLTVLLQYLEQGAELVDAVSLRHLVEVLSEMVLGRVLLGRRRVGAFRRPGAVRRVGSGAQAQRVVVLRDDHLERVKVVLLGL